MQRRDFLRYCGAAFAALEASSWYRAPRGDGVRPGGFAGRFQEIPRPVPPLGQAIAERFDPVDDLRLPQGYEQRILARWGDRFGAIEFGTNCDHCAILPVPGRAERYWLMVNHEYVSLLPWLQGFALAKGRELPQLRRSKKKLVLAGRKLGGLSLDLEAEGDEDENEARAAARLVCREALADLGLSLLELELNGRGELVVAADGRHRRIHAFGTVNVAAADRPRFAGPGARRLGAPRGSMCNCSGGVSPWGTFFSCEENFQDYTTHRILPDGRVLGRRLFGVNGHDKQLDLPRFLEGIGQGAPDGPLDGRHYGWVAEIEPATGRLVKQIALGRFRHENVAIAATAGKALAVYMGDDARGGHVWKFVSRRIVARPEDPANSALLADGSLMVARFETDHRGRWLALEPETPLVRPRPERCAGGSMLLPRRSPEGDLEQGGHERVGRGGRSVDAWIADLEGFTGKAFAELTLGDLVRPTIGAGEDARELKRWVILMDAFAMANCIGASPAARPEDLECEFGGGGVLNVFVSFTDFGGDDDGSPDLEAFPEAAGTSSRRHGGIRHLSEKDGDPAALEFLWGDLVMSGEPADGGGGFAAPDNLVIDPDGEIWFVTDMSEANAEVASRGEVPPGSKAFQGLFGNNAMWWLPRKGRPVCFAQGPMEAELTGPAFLRTRAGETLLLLSVQHPGEQHGRLEQDRVEERRYVLRGADDEMVTQKRRIPLGSRFAAAADGVPRSAVCVIRRCPERK
ncbi:MAG: DUF839 domain-containing protein [Planctomycetes bacterium]|nr:DUF839 domain-containing protein [Planctomycetota bacterium]